MLLRSLRKHANSTFLLVVDLCSAEASPCDSHVFTEWNGLICETASWLTVHGTGWPTYPFRSPEYQQLPLVGPGCCYFSGSSKESQTHEAGYPDPA